MNDSDAADRIAWQTAFLLIAAVPLTALAMMLDTRLINDISIWTKPLKFELSLVLHLITIAIVIRLMPYSARRARWLGITVAFIAAACLFEVLVINMQSARGVGSHFNTSTPFDAHIYQLMGVGALTLTLPVIAIGLRFLKLPTSVILTPGLRLGVILGLTLGAVLTFLIAGYLSMQPAGHWVGAPRTDVGGLPVLGWSRGGGDLRAPHFFATHLMQLLPLAGWITDRKFVRGSRWPRRIVWISAVAGVGITVGTFIQALDGRPFL